jgi:VanZ family protein|tara:strand:+ start:188 stop:538 length:351 start_codon:yes stop_codon:yes gene_type:complete
MNKINYIRFVFLLTIVFTSILSFISIDASTAKILIQDKLLHVLAFFVISFLAYASDFKIKRIILFVVLILYGLLIEVIQNSLEYRTFELYDLLSDTIGIIFGYIAWKYLKNFYPGY